MTRSMPHATDRKQYEPASRLGKGDQLAICRRSVRSVNLLPLLHRTGITSLSGLLFPAGPALFENLAERWLIAPRQSAVPCRHRAPPGFQRLAAAGKLHAHAIGEFDPIGEAGARDRDHHGNIGTQRPFDHAKQSLAVALALAEPVDDHEVRARLHRAGYPWCRVLQPVEVKLAAASRRSRR